jgi:hypothetical protein
MCGIRRIRLGGGVWESGLFALVLAAYLSTLSRSVGHEDSGELAASAYVLGVAHPTGYPLFTLLGRAFSLLPVDASVIWKLNLLSALLCAAAAVLFFRLFLNILSRIGFRSSVIPGRSDLSNRIAAAGGALLLAFSPTYWAAAVEVEVHGLHLVLLATALLLHLSAMDAWVKGRSTRALRLWLLAAYAFGLGLANHMTILLAAPAILYLNFAIQGWGVAAWYRLLVAGIPLLTALSVYLYLPLRALNYPVMNWGNPHDAKGFVWHLTAEQFRLHMFSSSRTALRKLGEILADLPDVLGPVPLLAALIGVVMLGKSNGRIFTYTVLIFVACLAYAINHDFEDPSYRLNAHVVLALWAAVGLRFLCAFAGKREIPAAALLCAVFVGASFASNLRLADRSADHVVEDYARNVLNSADSGALILSGEYRRLVAPAYYLQLVEGYRTDVAILSVSLLETPWYLNQFGTRHPDVLLTARKEAESFLASMGAILHREPGATRADYLRRLVGFQRALIENNLPVRSVYVTTALQATAPDPQRVPVGMLFRFPEPRDSPSRPEIRRPSFRPFPPEPSSSLAHGIRQEYADAVANMAGNLVLAYGDTLAGVALLREALVIQPGFPAARQLLKELEGDPGVGGVP